LRDLTHTFHVNRMARRDNVVLQFFVLGGRVSGQERLAIGNKFGPLHVFRLQLGYIIDTQKRVFVSRIVCSLSVKGNIWA
jgi:hypothetical protein